MSQNQNNKICRFFEANGTCKFGNQCRYSHQLNDTNKVADEKKLQDHSKLETQNEKSYQPMQSNMGGEGQEGEFSLFDYINKSILNDIFYSGNLKKIGLGFTTLHKAMQQIAPNPQSVADLQSEYFRIKETNQELQKAIPSLPLIFEVSQQQKVSIMFLKCLLSLVRQKKQQLDFSIFTDQVKESMWKNIPPELLLLFLEVFDIDFNSIEDRFLDHMYQLIDKGKQEYIVQVLYVQLPIQKDKFLILVNKLIQSMAKNNLASKAADLIHKFKLNPEDYPQILERLEKGCVRYYLKEYPWYFLEDLFKFKPRMLGYIVEDLFHKKKIEEAYAICVRNKLMERQFIKKAEVIQHFSKFPPNKAVIENPMVALDDYKPHEENMKLAAPGTYINLLSEKQIFFIHDDKQECYKQCIQELKQAKEVGFDTEFSTKNTKLDTTPDVLCLIQLGIFDQATQNYKAYLFDAVAILGNQNQVILNDLVEIFSNNNYKIGLSIGSDLSQLQKFFKNQQFFFRNYIETQEIFKDLYPNEKKSGLKNVVQTVLKIDLSKMEQMSNWLSRPLRKAQMVYAGMDAVVLIEAFRSLKQQFGKEFIEKLMEQAKQTTMISAASADQKSKDKKNQKSKQHAKQENEKAAQSKNSKPGKNNEEEKNNRDEDSEDDGKEDEGVENEDRKESEKGKTEEENKSQLK